MSTEKHKQNFLEMPNFKTAEQSELLNWAGILMDLTMS